MRLYIAVAFLGICLAAVAGILFGIFPSGLALPLAAGKAHDTGLNLVMIILDGIRVDEFMGKADAAQAAGDDRGLFQYFWKELTPTGTVYGDRRRGELMTVANSAVYSLPAYESIFAGSTQPCQDNDCDRTGRETLQERLVADLALPRRQVATVASWEGLTFAVESHPGRSFVNAGAQALHGDNDEAERLLNEKQKADAPPWDDSRFDKYTWQHALRYLDRERPRFLFISLEDADGWAHRSKYAQYLSAIHDYDEHLRELVRQLGRMDDYGRKTCVLVTTDHGRGTGPDWRTHSNGTPYAGLVLMYAGCPLAPELVAFRPPAMVTTHLSIRPTAEALFGLSPYRCLLCGSSLIDRVNGGLSQSAN